MAKYFREFRDLTVYHRKNVHEIINHNGQYLELDNMVLETKTVSRKFWTMKVWSYMYMVHHSDDVGLSHS